MIAEALFRLPLMLLTFSSVVLVLGKLTLMPNQPTDVKAAIALPTHMPLKGWHAIATKPLIPPTTAIAQTSPEMVVGNIYTYRRDRTTLTVAIRYLVETDPSVRNLLLKYGEPAATVPFDSTIQQQEETGFYSLYSTQENTYLSSCINSRGKSTVTEAQFNQNRYRFDLRLDRAFPVLLGRETLRDGRCLFTVMSIPLRASSPQATERLLKDAWTSWYQGWQPQFPPPRP